MIRQVNIVIGMMLVCVGLGIGCLVFQPAHLDGKAHVYMLNIGQGDSFLIVAANGKKILIDGGRDATVLGELSKVLAPSDRSIDVMIATHPDADHIGGLPYVLARYHVGLFLTSQVFTDTKTFTTLYGALEKQHVPSYFVRHGMAVVLDDGVVTPSTKATFTVLFPDRDTSGWETNAASVVGRLQVGNTSALFTGDSPSSIEHFLIGADPKDLDVDILKLGHHGSKYSSSDEYLRATSPVLGLISAGVDNKYHHPSIDTLSRLQVLGIPWVSTQDHGTVTLTTDGTKWSEGDEL